MGLKFDCSRDYSRVSLVFFTDFIPFSWKQNIFYSEIKQIRVSKKYINKIYTLCHLFSIFVYFQTVQMIKRQYRINTLMRTQEAKNYKLNASLNYLYVII